MGERLNLRVSPSRIYRLHLAVFVSFGASDFGITNRLKDGNGPASTYGGETYLNTAWTSGYRSR